MLICGAKYSGKKTLVREITDESFVYVENKVESIRELSGGNYIFVDIDDWAAPCFSAILKLLEDNEKHIILTCKSEQNLPPPVRSRCIIEYMEPYTGIKNYCDNPGQLEHFTEGMLTDIDHFTYKEEYDLDVFFSVLCNRLIERIRHGENLAKELLICSLYNANKTMKSLNKKQFIACWKLDISGDTENWKGFRRL